MANFLSLDEVNQISAGQNPSPTTLSLDDVNTHIASTPKKTLREIAAEQEAEQIDRFDPVIPSSANPETQQSWDSLGRTVGKGVRDAAVGLATLPTDISGMDDISARINSAVPDVKLQGEGEKLGATAIQYLVPGMVGYKAAGAVAKAHNLGKLPSYIAKLMGASVADEAVTNPQSAETIGTALNAGPTAINPDDSNMDRRAKVGAESFIVSPMLDSFFNIARWSGKAVLSGLSRYNNEGVMDLSAKILQDKAGFAAKTPEEKQALVKEMEQKLRGAKDREGFVPGYQPTTGTMSGNEELLAMERGLTNTGENAVGSKLHLRQNENSAAVSQAVSDAVKTDGDRVAAAQRYADAYNIPLEQAQKTVDAAHEAAQQAYKDLDADLASYTTVNGGQSNAASESLDEAARNELFRQRGIKNALFEKIDPHNQVVVDTTDIANVVKDLTTPKSISDMRPERIASDANAQAVIDKIRQLMPQGQPPTPEQLMMSRLNSMGGKQLPGAAPQLTFGQLYNDIRPRVSDAINSAVKQGDRGDVVKGLTQLRDAIDDTANQIIERGGPNGEAAQDAMDFYSQIYAPTWLQLTGKKYRDAVVRGTQDPARTASQFVSSGPGASTKAETLNTIMYGPREGYSSEEVMKMGGMPNPKQAEEAVRAFALSELSSAIDKSNPMNTVTRIDAFQRKYTDFLQRFPKLADEIDQTKASFAGQTDKVTSLEKELTDAKTNQVDLTQELNKSIFRAFAKDNTDVAVSRIFSGSNPKESMKQLIDATQGNPDAMEGLKALIRDHIQGQVFSKTQKIYGQEEFQAMVGKMNKVFETPKNREALEMIYTPEQMANLDAARNTLMEMDNINKQRTARSDTASLLSNAEQFRTFLASFYGIVKGQGIFQISKNIIQFMGRDPATNARILLGDAMLDPELAANLLARNVDTHAEDRIKAYIIHNYPGWTEGKDDERDDEMKRLNLK